MNLSATDPGSQKGFEKQAYHTPELVQYGDIGDLTGGAFSSMMDSDNSMTLNPKMGGGGGNGAADSTWSDDIFED